MRHLAALALVFAVLGMPAGAGEPFAVEIGNPVVYVATPNAMSGAAYMTLTSRAPGEDRLIGAESPVAARVELHTSSMDAGGVMRMEPVEGIELGNGQTHALARGGDHIMLMGIKGPLEPGQTVPITLIWEKSGSMTVEAIVTDKVE